MTPRLLLPLLRPDQTTILRHPAKLKVVSAGRRWGKTLMGGTMAVSAAFHGGQVAWVTPTYKNARPLWRFAERHVVSLGPAVAVNKTDRTIEFRRSRGMLGLYTADNDVGLRGEAFDLVIVDEAAQVSPETYTDVILPTLADRDGACILISTPKGLNWFWLEYQAALSDGQDRAAWQAPTSANPLPAIQRAVELARDRVAERTYRQEWLAEFLADGAGVFRRVTEAATATAQERAIPGHEYVLGVDWGKLNDFTVLSVLDTTTRAQVYLDRFNRIDYHFQVERLRAVYDRFRPRRLMAEANSIGEPLIEMLRRQNLPVVPWTATNASKADAIESLALAFERRDLTILPDRVQTGELLAYDVERLPSGLLRYGAPEGGHDDTVMALALAWQLAQVPDRQTAPRGVLFGDRREVARSARPAIFGGRR